MRIEITPQELRRIVGDYTMEEDIFNYDDEQLELYNKINSLEEADRIILSLYAEYQSLRKVAKLLGVSYSTTRQQINKIKSKIC